MCSRLLTVCLVTAILTFGRYHANGGNEFEDIYEVMKDLEYIETKEGAQRSSDPEAGIDAIEAQRAYCKAIPYVDGEDDFVNLVDKKLKIWSDCSAIWSWQIARAEWDFETNINKDTEAKLNAVDVEVTGYFQKIAVQAKQLTLNPEYTSLGKSQQRQLRLLSLDDSPKSEDAKKKLSELQTRLQNVYSNAEVDGKPMEPSITKIMASSRDPDILERYWVGWRDVTGKLLKNDYEEFVAALNRGAVENGYHDYGQSWLEGQFDNVVDIKKVSEELWQEVKPLYEQLHAYVREKLAVKYPIYKNIYDKGGIPAHLTGNMWAQEWNNIYSLLKPFPEVDEPNYDQALKDKGYTAKDLFDLAEEFYTSIGLYPMPPKFHQNSMIERPPDRDVVCHASASDLYLNDDVRIKMCTEVNTEYLETIHHEMGHVEYFIAYKNQPTVFRTGANSGFHEAIGDTISLSVLTPKHMKALNLTSESPPSVIKSAGDLTDDKKREINSLLKVALSKIAFLPFGYLIDKWRWDVFDGTVDKNHYNTHWWDLRLKYQGIMPPVPRTEADFDPGAKFHIPTNSPYICYFISFIIQFQFYESMCKAAGQLSNGEPLHTCDFYKSTAAGTLLRDMMALGESQPWNETLETITGSPKISSSSILKYFQPLQTWLQAENTREGTTIGWSDNTPGQSRHASNYGDTQKSMEPSEGLFRSRYMYERLAKVSRNHRKFVNDNTKHKKEHEINDEGAHLIALIRRLRDDKTEN